MIYELVPPSRATGEAKLEGEVCEKFPTRSRVFLGSPLSRRCGWGVFSIERSGSTLLNGNMLSSSLAVLVTNLQDFSSASFYRLEYGNYNGYIMISSIYGYATV